MINKFSAVLAVSCFTAVLCGAAGSGNGVTESVRAPFPKLLINDDTAKHNKFIPARLAGREVSVLAVKDHATVVSDNNDAVYEVEGALNGQYSLAERYFESSGKINVSTPSAVNYEPQPFSESGLPGFNAYSGNQTDNNAYEWEQEALKRYNPELPVQATIENLTEALKYQPALDGYNKALSYLSFAYLKHDEYGRALTIIEQIVKSSPDKETLDFVRFQSIIALLELGQLKTALGEIAAYDNTKFLPAAYKEYLTRSCLRQIEREDALDRAINNPANKTYADKFVELKTIIQDDFKAKAVVTLFPAENDITNKTLAAQAVYEEAKSHYLNENYSDAKPLLLELLKTCPGEYVSAQDKKFKAGPAVLDMLGSINLKDKDAASAMDCFKTMVAVFPYDVYVGPEEGAFVYGGPAGAEGLLFQIEILSNNRYFTEMDNLKTDYEQAVKLSHQLIKKYDGKSPIYYEDGPNYEELAASSITECLKQLNASPERWKKEVFQIVKETKNGGLSANLLLDLGNKCKQQKDVMAAINIYSTIINKYGYSYNDSLEGDQEFTVPSFEAFEQLTELLKQEGRHNDMVKMQSKIDNIYQNLKKKLIEEDDDNALESLAQKYKECLNVK